MRTRSIIAALVALTLSTSGCGTADHTYSVIAPAPRGRSRPAARISPAAEAPRSVAADFFRAWGSYDAVHDRTGAFVARCRPLVTARLARELVDERPASADWAAKRERREVSVVRVSALRQPDGAPRPSSRRVYLRVYGDRITTSRVGRAVAPTGITLVVVHRGGRWLVDRVLFV